MDGRADLFSLGVVLYRMLLGRSPFQRDGVLPTLGAVRFDHPPPAASLSAELPAPLSALIDRLLAKNPADRPASARVVLTELLQAEKRAKETAATATAAPIPQPADPWADIDATTAAWTNHEREQSEEPTATAAHAADPPRRPRPRLLIGSLFAFVLVALAGFIVIKIKNKDGTETEIKVPDGATVEVTKDGKTLGKFGPDPGKAEPLPPWTPPKPIPVGQSPFGKLDPADDQGLAFWDLFASPPVERWRIPWEALPNNVRQLYERVAFSPCGRWLVIHTGRGTDLWRCDGPEPRRIGSLDANDLSWGEAGFTPDGNTVVVGDREGLVRFWELQGERPEESFPFDPATAFRHHTQNHSLVRLARATGTVMLARTDREPPTAIHAGNSGRSTAGSRERRCGRQGSRWG